MTRSWKTTLAGVLTVLGIIGTQLGALFDADPLTVINWPILLAAIPGLGLLAARDNGVTSEKAGAKG